MRKYLALTSIVVLFAANLVYLFSSAVISALFEPNLALSVLETDEIRRGLAEEIVALAELPEELQKPISESLYRALSPQTLKPVLKKALPAFRTYLSSYGRLKTGLWLDITPIKEFLIQDLKRSSPAEEHLIAAIPDQVDISGYLYLALPVDVFQTYRAAETTPRIAGVLVVLMTVAYLLLYHFSGTAFEKTGKVLGLSSAIGAALAYVLPGSVRTAALSRVLAGIDLPEAVNAAVLKSGPTLLAGKLATDAVLMLIPACVLYVVGRLRLPEKLVQKEFLTLISCKLLNVVGRIRPTGAPAAGRGEKLPTGTGRVTTPEAVTSSAATENVVTPEAATPSTGASGMSSQGGSAPTPEARGLTGWMRRLAGNLRENAMKFEQVRLTPEYRTQLRKGRMVSIAGHILVYALLVGAIPLFFNPKLQKPFPPYGSDQIDKVVRLYDGELHFSGTSAFDYLQKLIHDNPERRVGTDEGVKSAQWVQEQFARMGLKTRLEEFSFALKRPKRAGEEQSLLGTTVADLAVYSKGVNVVAESPGKVRDVILIGAHRDTAGRYPGAEDNGSGTASMLELARVLTSGDHLYTYVFVSFDGEEVGLKGSEAFVSMNRQMPVKLAIILDMTGFKGADTVGFYPTATAKGQTPLWTVVLANKVLTSPPFGLSPFYWDAGAVEADSSVLLYWQARVKKTAGRIPTDSEPFVNSNIPAIGIMAARTGASPGSLHGRIIHGDEDVLDQVSPRTLELTGRFVEQYVKSLEYTAKALIQTGVAKQTDPGSFLGIGDLDSKSYVITPGSILTPEPLRAFAIYAVFLALFLLALTLTNGPTGLNHTGRFALMELPWLCGLAVLAWVSALIPGFLSSPAASSLPFFLIHASWFVISVGGTALLTFLRGRFLKETGLPYSWVTIQQKRLLNLLYCILLLAMIPVSNPFIAFETMLLPLFFFGRINHGSDQSRALWTLGLGFWLFWKFVGSGNWLKRFIFEAPLMPAPSFLFLAAFSWMVTVLYIMSTPPADQPIAVQPRLEHKQTGQP
ncbi:MAG: M28 family peptidase [Firmicutes bacterium]|nr:M28 family peptidase [Candidatus Fermentithermobacillaceae bacterium]